MKMITDAGLWDELDGALFATNIHWWGQGLEELYPFFDELLLEYHPDKIEDIKLGGRSYVTAALHNEMCQIIKGAVESVGVANIDSQAIYDAAQNHSLVVEDDVLFLNFSKTKRNGYNYYVMAEADAELQTLVTASDWLPVVTGP